MKLTAWRKFFGPVYRTQGGCFVFMGLLSIMIFLPGAVQAAAEISDSMPETIPAEIIADWEAQDGTGEGGYAAAIDNIISTLPSKYKSKITAGDTKEAYLVASHWRRVYRMEYYKNELKRILFARHYNLGGPTPGYLEDLGDDDFKSGIGNWQSALSKGSNYAKGSALCLLEMTDYYSRYKEILTDTGGVIRDPCVWFDGTKVVFAWSKDNNGYHLYEMPIDSADKVRQLTSNPEGLMVSDFEPCYLPDSNIIFNSSRCFGFISSGQNVNSNLYITNKDGKFLRRITYDPFSTFSPSIMEDGYVLYSRWEANDRNSYSCFPLMSMNVDGVHQIEYFGNNSTWPGTIFQARRAPEGSTLIFAIISVHQSPYAGELVTIDPGIIRNGSKAVTLIAPEREPADTANIVSGAKPLFQNPYPFDEDWFLVSWRPSAQPPDYAEKFNIYLMNVEGERELVAWDSAQSVSQPFSLVPRDVPSIKSYQADYEKTFGRMTLYNTYYGLGVDSTVDSASWAVKKLRIVALDLRTGPAFGNTGSTEYCMTPVARWLGTRDAKRIVGETPVEKDGSAAFQVPPRTPIYLQLIDVNGCVIQSMRSTVMVQPGELFACYGCHEDKNVSTKQGRLPLLLTPTPLVQFTDMNSSDCFSFPKHIQPIFDDKCISCHTESHSTGLNLRGDLVWTGELTGADNKDANRNWSKSYLILTDPTKQYVNYIPSTSPAEHMKPYSFGSIKSMLISKLKTPPDAMKSVSLTAEQMAKLCAWIDLGIPFGGYTEGMKPEIAEAYNQRLARRTQYEQQIEAKNIQEFIDSGGYPISVREPYRRVKNNSNSSGCLILARFFRPLRQLAITLPSEGTVTLVDLRGRTVWSLQVDREAYLENATISERVVLPAGIYVVNFKGIKGTARQRISML